MCNHPPFWNEHGERIAVPISSSDAGLDDIPVVMRERRDLRHALDKALRLLTQIEYEPIDRKSSHDWEYINRIIGRIPL
jgi:hypothetical protein